MVSEEKAQSRRINQEVQGQACGSEFHTAGGGGGEGGGG